LSYCEHNINFCVVDSAVKCMIIDAVCGLDTKVGGSFLIPAIVELYTKFWNIMRSTFEDCACNFCKLCMPFSRLFTMLLQHEYKNSSYVSGAKWLCCGISN